MKFWNKNKNNCGRLDYLQQYRVVYKQFGWGIFLIIEATFKYPPHKIDYPMDALRHFAKFTNQMFDTEPLIVCIFFLENSLLNVLDSLKSHIFAYLTARIQSKFSEMFGIRMK